MPPAAEPPAAVAPTAPPVAAAAPVAALPPPKILPMKEVLSRASGPIGRIAASALRSLRSCLRKPAQPSQLRTWRRTGPVALVRPSAASARVTRTSSQLSVRDSLDSASVIRARTSSDLTAGIVVSMATAISS